MSFVHSDVTVQMVKSGDHIEGCRYAVGFSVETCESWLT
jgi:hypothetical protein